MSLIMTLLCHLSSCAAQRGSAAQPQYSAGGANNNGAAFLQAALSVALNPAVDQAAVAASKVLAKTAVQGGTRSGSSDTAAASSLGCHANKPVTTHPQARWCWSRTCRRAAPRAGRRS